MFDLTYQEYKDELKKYAALGVRDAALDLGYDENILQSKFTYEHIWHSLMMRDEVSVRTAESVDIKHLEEHDIVIRDGVVMFKEDVKRGAFEMDKIITVRALESFSVHNHDEDETELLGEVEKGEVLLAYLHEGSGEYFAEDRQGRDMYVGELDIHENLNLDSGFKLVQIGMTVEHKKNFLFKAIASMGHGSGHMSWANNCIADIEDVPDEVKARMKQINEQIHGLQEELRMIRDSLHLQEQLRMIRDSLHECCPDCSPDEN